MRKYDHKKIEKKWPAQLKKAVSGKQNVKKYNHDKIESKWQRYWSAKKIYKTKEGGKKSKCYVLDMFPYPSGEGLHVGHPRGYIATDVYSRFKRMNGFNVLHPMGFDSFGLPAENYAIKNKIHPEIAVKNNVKKFKGQLGLIGFDYDWDREIITSDPNFYKWTQWIFLKMFEKGLAYESYEPINFCPSCLTGLANEDVEDGKCERCGTPVIKKPMRQWVLKITDYAERMLEDLEELKNWPENIKEAQRNWIGKSEGTTVKFLISKSEFLNKSQISNNQNKNEFIEVFTTRIDTIFGCAYLVLSPEHPAISNLKFQISNLDEVEKYIAEAKNKSDLQRTDLAKEKTGVELKGLKAINPFNNEEVPVWVADYVLGGYGTGAVMAVPAHDERDFEFAKKYNLPISYVVQSNNDAHDNKDNISKVIILHGRQQFEKKDKQPMNIRHWLGWLKDELEKANIKTINPLIKKDWEATYTDWKNEFNKIQIDENTILVGTSAGGAFLVRWLGETRQVVKKLILVAPSYHSSSNKDVNKKEFYNFTIDKEIRERIKNIIIYISNDTKEQIEAANLYGQELNAKLVKLDSRGHFTETSNPINKQFPELLNVILGNENVFIDDGILTNSEQFDGLDSKTAREKMTRWLEERSLGGRKINYKLKDWVFSRQRYWGEPIPLIHCENCGIKDIKTKLNLDFHGEYRWNAIINGKKTVETRALYLLERKNLRVGDLVRLENKTTKQIKIAKIIEVNIFKNLFELSKRRDLIEKIFPDEKISDLKSLEERYERVDKGYISKINEHGLAAWKIALINAEKIIPVPEKDLPVKLPKVKFYEPTDTGESPLAKMEKWVNVKCPKCGGKGKRETNTMPQWAGSSWYFLAYIMRGISNFQFPISKYKKAFQHWMPIDMYVGGTEHATRHLIYARFWHKFLYDIGIVGGKEPFASLKNQGLIMGNDGRKMSKRWGNIVNPDDVVSRFGADTLRVYEMFMGPFDQPISWSTDNMVGSRRFLERAYSLSLKIKSKISNLKTENSKMERLLHQTIKKVTEDIENFHFNTAISSLMILLNEMEKCDLLEIRNWKLVIKLISPFAPHIAEELWAELGGKKSIHLEKWPEWDRSKIESDETTIVVQINGKIRGSFKVEKDKNQEEIENTALSLPEIKKYIGENEIKKIFFVKDKIVSIVV